MTQAEQILNLLRERGKQGATNYELMQISYQYPARLHTLRHKEGHNISAKHLTGTKWKIELIEEATRPVKVKPQPIPFNKEQYLRENPF